MEYSLFTKLAAEFVGTAVLMIFGNGAVANVELKNTKGHNAGWLNIAMGYGFGVMFPVLMFGGVSGAHINPAMTIAQAIAALEAPLSDEQRHEILDKARQAAYEDNKTPVVLHYCVATNGNVGSAEGFANTVFRVLNNPQGWPRAGVIYAPTHDTNACEFTIMLAESSKLAEYSQGCSAEYSCRVGTDVIINKKRWDEAVEHWFAHGETLSQYRTMVLNHEVGHVLGHVDNETVCEGEGKRAPLMQEQSMDLRGCTPNAWPLDNELWTAY